MKAHLMKLAGALALTAATLGSATTAGATVLYNQTVSPGTANEFGTGVGNDGFACETSGGVTICGRGRSRSSGTTSSTGTGLYGPFDTGYQPGRSDRASWNYDLFVQTAQDLTYSLCVNGSCGNPFSAFTDWVGAFSTGIGNSEQILFAESPGHAGYDVFANGLYHITFSASNADGVVASTAFDVQVGDVPEPGEFALFGAALGALAFTVRRKKQLG